MMKLIDKILKLKGQKAVSEKEYDTIQKYRTARSDLKDAIEGYNALLNFFLENASIKELKTLLKIKGVEDIPSEKDKLKYEVRAAYTKEFKKN